MTQKRNVRRYVILTVVALLILAVGAWIASRNAMMFSGQTAQEVQTYLVKVEEVLSTETTENPFSWGGSTVQTQTQFSGRVLFGKDKGQTLTAVQHMDANPGMPTTIVEKGDWLFLYDMGTGEYIAGNYFRVKTLALLLVILIVFLLLFARLKGVATVLALGLTIAAVFIVFIPAILSGYNVYLWTILICIYSIAITPLYIGGFERKALAAILGCGAGVLLAGLLTSVLNQVMKITGVASEEDMYVLALLPEPINMRAITFAAILIGALGSCLDVSMSVAAAVWEMGDSGKKPFSSLLQSGFNIGRDILGTQISTLILAYIGSSLSVVLLLIAYQPSAIEMLNVEAVVIQLMEMLVGVSAILLTIPLTAFTSAVLIGGASGKPNEAEQKGGEERIIFHSEKR